MLASFLSQGKKGNICFFVLIIRFREFGDENNTVIFQIISKFEQPNHLKREKTKKKKHFFPLPPGYPQNPDPISTMIFARIRIRKKCGSETLPFMPMRKTNSATIFKFARRHNARRQDNLGR